MAVSQFRYRAFISYSHRDQTVARWLHGALESYRVPARLVGKETATGTIARRIGAIFRDRDELPVASDLSGKINEALADTQFLIVLCSPASAQSKWVNQEVINFKRLKGEDSIIAVIIGGEPFASSIPGREAEECFVPALRFRVGGDGTLTAQPAEPIAADLRPEKDSKRLVKLKVIAGLLGLGLDELVRRENQRRTQRLFWLSTGMAAGMVVMGVLTINAIRANQDAQRQKMQAEDLIEFMLGDLRQKLEPVGRLDVLDSVGQRALKYFGTLSADELDADTLGRKARTLHLIGEMQDLRSELEKSRATFREAADTTAELLRRDADNPDRIYEHAQSLHYLAYSSRENGDFPSAIQEFEERKRYAMQLMEKSPDAMRSKTEVAMANEHLGYILVQAGRLQEGIAILSESQRAWADISATDPKNVLWKQNLALTHDSLADAFYNAGDLERSKGERSKESDIYRKLLEDDPNNKTQQRWLMVASRSIGLVDLDLGLTDSALVAFRKAVSVAEGLAGADPENTTWIEILGRFRLDIADALYDKRDYSGSANYVTSVEKLISELSNKDSPKAKWDLLLGLRAQLIKAKILLATRDYAGLKQLTQETIETLEVKRESLNRDASFASFMGKIHLLQGNALERLGDRPAAERAWATALTWLRDGRSYYIYEGKMYEAETLKNLGQLDQALNILSDPDMRLFRRPDAVALKHSISSSRTQEILNGR